MRRPSKVFGQFITLLLLVVAAGCSRERPAATVEPAQTQPQTTAAAPQESYRFLLILTNVQTMQMETVVAITKTNTYERHQFAKDGKDTITHGTVPAELSDSLAAEWAAHTASTNADPALSQPAYVSASTSEHPSHVQQLLDYLGK